MNIFSYLKDRVQIVDIIKEYASLKKVGIYYKGRCPFHHEKDASFTVSPHKQIFYCFGCHATGDAIAFIAQIEGCTQREAVQFIVDKYNIEIPSSLLHDKQEFAQTIQQKNSYFRLCQVVADWCSQQRVLSLSAQKYLETRTITHTTQEQFHVGYFPPGSDALKKLQQHAQKNGFLVKDLIDNHIIIDSPRGLYSPFEDRIIFPISDHMGRFCGFGGRIFNPTDERAKYYNSRENTFFNKGSLLFGLHTAKKAIQQSTQAFLVEGYFDCIAMVQHGYQNTIATLGTACTSDHLKLLAHYADTLYVIFDGDAAGLRAMLRLTQLCWHANINIRIICLPKNEDPASFLSKGERLSSYIEQAQDIFTFFINNAGKNFRQQSLKGKLAIVHELLTILGSVEDKIKQALLIQEAAESINLPYALLQSACHSQQKTPKSETVSTPDYHAVFSQAEQQLVRAVLENPKLLEHDTIILIFTFLPEPIQRIFVHFKNLQNKTVHDLAEVLEPEDKNIFYTLLMASENNKQQDKEDILFTITQQYWKTIAQKIKEEIAQAQQQNNTTHVTQLLEQLQELKKKILIRSSV